MASNKDKAFALFYTTATAAAVAAVAIAVTATAIVVVIATKQASKRPINQPTKQPTNQSTNQAGIESIANLGLLRLQLKEKHSLFNYKS